MTNTWVHLENSQHWLAGSARSALVALLAEFVKCMCDLLLGLYRCWWLGRGTVPGALSSTVLRQHRYVLLTGTGFGGTGHQPSSREFTNADEVSVETVTVVMFLLRDCTSKSVLCA